MDRWPINSSPHLPGIDQVPHDVERLYLIIAKKIEEGGGFAAARSEMDIGNPGCPQAAGRRRRYDANVSKPRELIGSLHCA